ncbi:hypothetical protein [Tepidibacillus marianensis]|uniref:hypothetical protein n=1 Tax=Tepidibacillus marianensis TaxID=3131995 RepID=UPI0030CE88C3
MKNKTPWFGDLFDYHYFPSEEFQVCRVGINEDTGKEEVIHYSHTNQEFETNFYVDPISYYSFGFNDRLF